MATKPIALQAGDTIGIIAPSDAVEKESLEESAKIPKSWGLKVKFGQHVYSRVGDFCAGTADERREDLKTMIYDPDVKAIWCATGGYAATEVLSVFNKESIAHLREHPKLFIGYSDVCMLLNALASFSIVSLMGPTLWGLPDWDKESQEMIRKFLFGEPVLGIDASSKWKAAIPGIAEGKLIACDLETLIFSFGTKYDPIMYGGSGPLILCLEELDIDKSTLQRQIDIIFNHKRASRIKGMVVGRLVNIRELSYPEWGMSFTPEGIFEERVKKIGIPLAFCNDFGHAEWDYPPFRDIKKYFGNRKFLTIPNCINARLTVDNKETKLEYLESVTKEGVISPNPLSS